MKDTKKLLKNKLEEIKQNKKQKSNYVNHEFQDFGLRIASKLEDSKHKALYIRLAKVIPRALVEDSLNFATNHPNPENKARLFMWKLKERLQDYKDKHPDFELPKLSRGRTAKKKSNGKKVKKQKSTNLNYSLFNH